jgi:DnaJ domain
LGTNPLIPIFFDIKQRLISQGLHSALLFVRYYQPRYAVVTLQFPGNIANPGCADDEVFRYPGHMANPNYKKIYSILGVFQDDDWDTVRAAYKRQIRRWHPDRFQDTDQRKIAEDKSKDINLAYQTLDDYYREFGSLPPDDTAQHETPLSTGELRPAREYDTDPEHHQFSGADSDQTSFRKSQQPRRRGFSGIIVTGVVIAIGYLLLEPSFTDIDNVSETNLPGPGYDKFGPAAGNFTANQTESSAPTVAGTQSNSSDVHSDWQVDEKDKEYSPKSSPITGRPTIISIGSSKQDVLAIQGRPLRKTDTTWDYGLSRINFQDGIVTGWYENPMNPLNVKR